MDFNETEGRKRRFARLSEELQVRLEALRDLRDAETFSESLIAHTSVDGPITVCHDRCVDLPILGGEETIITKDRGFGTIIEAQTYMPEVTIEARFRTDHPLVLVTLEPGSTKAGLFPASIVPPGIHERGKPSTGKQTELLIKRNISEVLKGDCFYFTGVEGNPMQYEVSLERLRITIVVARYSWNTAQYPHGFAFGDAIRDEHELVKVRSGYSLPV